MVSLIITALPVVGRETAIINRPTPEISVHVSTANDILDNMRPFPADAQASVDHLFAFAANPKQQAYTPSKAEALVKFVIRACVDDSGWKLPPLAGAEGAAYVVTITTPLQQYLNLNFNPGIPDYAVFPAALRYSTWLDSNAMQRAYSLINTGPTGTLDYVTGKMNGTEEITPNPESGSYFSYTNSRTFLRGTIDGHDVLFSCAETTSPSTLSNRGVLVGPLDQALFYYSERQGLNLAGMTWMTSQIFHSTTLSVYIALNSNETAVASFAWLNAGWKGLNVTRTQHILNSQKTTLDFSRKIAESPHITPENLVTLINDVKALPDSTVNDDYGKYLDYVKAWRDRGKKGFFGCSMLQELFDEKANQSIPPSYRRALLVQERVRILLGIPTWSAVPSLTAVHPELTTL